jgi:thiamine biosynthesis protein ThiI
LEKVIIIRLGELFLKGKNRGVFERLLIGNIKEKLAAFACRFSAGRNRYIVSEYGEADAWRIIAALKTVFGVHSLSTGYRVRSDFDAVTELAVQMLPDGGTFRVSANRGDKTFVYNSMEMNRELGAKILAAKKGLSVDLHNPDFTLNVDVREDGNTYLFYDKIAGAGGMPAGSAGRGLLLLSGGIDSPVAGYLMAKRGLSLDALHFHSYPYTSEAAQKKVEKLASILENYAGKITLLMVPFTKIQEAIHARCADSFMITIMRRCMMRVAERIAASRGCGCIASGESLGQVASQTLESITVTNAAVKDLPVLRPLIGFDKQEIVEIAVKIGTYETSIQPFEDCCTVFLPERPVIKPKLKQCLLEEAKIPDLEELLDEAVGLVSEKSLGSKK